VKRWWCNDEIRFVYWLHCSWAVALDGIRREGAGERSVQTHKKLMIALLLLLLAQTQRHTKTAHENIIIIIVIYVFNVMCFRTFWILSAGNIWRNIARIMDLYSSRPPKLLKTTFVFEWSKQTNAHTYMHKPAYTRTHTHTNTNTHSTLHITSNWVHNQNKP